ncbi:facilitated trehalose transporter Tret1-like [Aricia agestis]|uniref:facilitated trehalose transporter Tret1-like n=1 Tax=Aricia agestis TaxID=91739 RepID=UPI001C20B5F0|nr:facilitated trehalose transporter Tret1-like [Aricia agestis]
MVYTITDKNLGAAEDKGCVWKQFGLCFAVSLLFFTHGVESNNLTISTHSGYFIFFNDVPWTTTALILASIFSGSLFCFCIDRLGRRFGIYVIVLLQGVSCVPLLLPHSEVSNIILHVLIGVSTAGLFTCVPIYLREISTIHSRGAMVGLMSFMTAGGYLVKLGLSSESMLYLTVSLVILQFLFLFTLIETPDYLIKVGKIEVARHNLAKLKCLGADDVYIDHEIRRLQSESDRARANGNLGILQIVRNRIWRDEMKIGFVQFTTLILNGSIIFLDQDKALIQLNDDIDPEKKLVPICLFLGSITCVVLLRILERKYILTAAFSIMILSMGTLAVFTQSDLTVRSERWLPVVALGVLVFGYGLAWAIPTVILTEMFNFEIRAFLVGVIFTYSQVLRIVHVHTFKYLEDFTGIYTLMYMFSAVNILGAIYTISAVPEIKMKNVRQIERQLKRVPLLEFKTVKV